MSSAVLVSPLDVQRDFVPHLVTESRAAWRSLINAAFGLPLDFAQQAIFEACTGRTASPVERVRELYLICGRGAGKSEETAFLAVYLSCFFTYTPSPGEDLVGMCIAADRRQARVVMRYIKAMMHSNPLLEAQIVKRGSQFLETANSITLKNGDNELRIEVHTASFRSVRGYTIPFVLCDEIAFWRDENSSNPDDEVLRALRPGMGRPSLKSIGGGMLICLSSPYAQKGALFKAFQKYFGKDSDRVLVWKADTLTMNPEYDQELIQIAYEEDPVAADCEYGANFHADVQALFDPEALSACGCPEREREPQPGITYRAFVDPAGGTGKDSMTIAIAHTEDGIEKLDVIRERRPKFSPEDVTKEFCELVKLYRLNCVTGDKYAGDWPRERFRAHGVDYQLADKSKSEIYKELLPMVNSGRVELLTDGTEAKRMNAQLGQLERRTGRSGKDSIDHPPNAHDDNANAAAGALISGSSSPQYRARVV